MFSVEAIRFSPAISNRYCEINTLYVILSGENRLRFAESKFCEVINGAKPRSECDDGIWFGVWVACHRKCNIPLVSHRDLEPYPCGATHLDFTSLSLGKISTTQIASQFSPLRMTG